MSKTQLRILITGVSGFVGRALLRYLESRTEFGDLNIAVTGVARSRIALQELENRYSFFRGEAHDVLDREMSFEPHDLVFHLASPASAEMIQSAPAEMFNVIVRGAENLISAISNWTTSPTVVLASSGAVYERPNMAQELITEDQTNAPSPLDPATCYAEGKRAAELLFSIADAHGSLKFKTARMFAFAGLDLPLDSHFALGNFIHNVINREPITIKGDPATERSYMWETDMAHWLFAIATKGARRRVYHVGSEDTRTMLEIATTVKNVAQEVFGIDVPVRLAPVDIAAVRSYYVPSTLRTRSELRLVQSIDLETSIQLMLRDKIDRRAR